MSLNFYMKSEEGWTNKTVENVAANGDMALVNFFNRMYIVCYLISLNMQYHSFFSLTIAGNFDYDAVAQLLLDIYFRHDDDHDTDNDNDDDDSNDESYIATDSDIEVYQWWSAQLKFIFV